MEHVLLHAHRSSFSYTYDALKRPSKVTVKSNSTQKFSTRQTYADRIGDSASTSNRVVSFGYYDTGNTPMFKWTYDYDNLGNITEITGLTNYRKSSP